MMFELLVFYCIHQGGCFYYARSEITCIEVHKDWSEPTWGWLRVQLCRKPEAER